MPLSQRPWPPRSQGAPARACRESRRLLATQVRLAFGERLGPTREIHAGSGYWSEDSACVVMASPERPSAIVVRWPGGRKPPARCLRVRPACLSWKPARSALMRSAGFLLVNLLLCLLAKARRAKSKRKSKSSGARALTLALSCGPLDVRPVRLTYS